MRTSRLILRCKATGLGMLVGLTLLACQPRSEVPASANEITENITVEVLTSYGSISQEEMIDQSDTIFLGRVISISPTTWNQNSGQPWLGEDAISPISLHSIEMEIVKYIVNDTQSDNQQMVITSLGTSPLEGQADHNLMIGDEAVVFVRQADLAWKEEGVKPIVGFMGDPMDSYYVLGTDGLYYGRLSGIPLSLDDLIKQIAQQRELLQP